MVLLPPSSQSPESVLDAVPPSTSSSNPHFLILFASVDPQTGQSWCPDCRDVEPAIEKHVPQQRSTLVYVGQRNEWKTPDNAYRKAFGISAVPTIIRLESGDKANLTSQISSAQKLVEGEILDESRLKEFLKAD
ncbi:hypothetical protein ACM66B_001492 [Microbotryomycetes sp. NB124-2]